MGLLDSLHRLLGSEVQGAQNIYHGLNPFDKQGWRPPAQVPVNHAPPAIPNAAPSALTQPLQGSVSNLNVGSTNTKLPPVIAPHLGAQGIQPYFLDNHVLYKPNITAPRYNLLNGSWDNSTFGQPTALKLNPQYIQNQFPMQSYLPRIGG